MAILTGHCFAISHADGSHDGIQTVRAVGRWTWRTDLAASQPFWEGWYQGLSGLLLGLKVPKLLVLADTNRLDTPLTVAQMQGRFQMQVVPQVGSCPGGLHNPNQ